MVFFLYNDDPTALFRIVWTGLSYNQVPSEIKAVNIDRAKQLFIGNQIGDIGEVERETEE